MTTHRIVLFALILFVAWQGWRYVQARRNLTPPPALGASATPAGPGAFAPPVQRR